MIGLATIEATPRRSIVSASAADLCRSLSLARTARRERKTSFAASGSSSLQLDPTSTPSTACPDGHGDHGRRVVLEPADDRPGQCRRGGRPRRSRPRRSRPAARLAPRASPPASVQPAPRRAARSPLAPRRSRRPSRRGLRTGRDAARFRAGTVRLRSRRWRPRLRRAPRSDSRPQTRSRDRAHSGRPDRRQPSSRRSGTTVRCGGRSPRRRRRRVGDEMRSDRKDAGDRLTPAPDVRGDSIGVVAQERALDASEQTAGFLGDLGEHLFREVFLGDERRHPPQRGLLVRELLDLGARLACWRPPSRPGR